MRVQYGCHVVSTFVFSCASDLPCACHTFASCPLLCHDLSIYSPCRVFPLLIAHRLLALLVRLPLLPLVGLLLLLLSMVTAATTTTTIATATITTSTISATAALLLLLVLRRRAGIEVACVRQEFRSSLPTFARVATLPWALQRCYPTATTRPERRRPAGTTTALTTIAIAIAALLVLLEQSVDVRLVQLLLSPLLVQVLLPPERRRPAAIERAILQLYS